MPPVTRDGPRTSSAAIRMTGRCRWITSYGWQGAAAEPLSSIPALTPKYRKSANAHFCAVLCRGSPRLALTRMRAEMSFSPTCITTMSAISTAFRKRGFISRSELTYATGRYMHYPRLSHSFEVEDVCGIVRLNYAGRVMFYNGHSELGPGLAGERVGGHSAGLQFVRVNPRRGFVV